MTGDVVPRSALRGIVEELVENRNRIAHGTDSAADVGRRYTYRDLERIYSDVNETGTHVIFALEEHVLSGGFRR